MYLLPVTKLLILFQWGNALLLAFNKLTQLKDELASNVILIVPGFIINSAQSVIFKVSVISSL